MKILFDLPLLDAGNLELIIIHVLFGAVVLALIIFFTFFLIGKYKNQEKVKNVSQKIKNVVSNKLWFDAVGGKENVVSIHGIGSRLTFYLKDVNIVQREKIERLGVSSVLVMANKVILVIENQAEASASKLNEDI